MPLIPSQSDICIIGAGPAGATASMFLSQMGIPHLLIDKDVFPRDKICGDGIDPNSIRVLNQFNPQLVADLLANTDQYQAIKGVRFTAPNGVRSEAMYRKTKDAAPEPMYITGKRLHFDHFLHQQLDPRTANIQLGATVTDIQRKENGVELTIEKDGATHTVFTRLLLGADGDHSIVQRKLDERKIDRRHYAAALRMYCAGVSDMHPENLIEVYFPKSVPLGYFWIFPLPNGEMNVGFGLASHEISRHKINLQKAFEQILTTDPFIAPRFAAARRLEMPRGWGLPLASRQRKNVGDNFLLVGDSGSLIQPLSGEGIGSAMIAGWTAAQFARKAVETQRFDAASMANYQRESVRRMDDEVRAYNFIMRTRPMLWQSHFLNVLIGGGIAKPLFERAARQWMLTATTKPLEVKF